MVFVKNNKQEQHDAFSSFEIPLAYLGAVHSFNEPPEFVQPLFKANYLEGSVKPLSSSAAPADGKIKLEFREGGCSLFLKVFLEVWRRCRINESRKQSMQQEQTWQPQQFVQHAALVDVSDPSKIYLSQPSYTPQPDDLFTSGGVNLNKN
eukprot:GHVH01007465.1.p1 GENE.GHVH01007465.1~~GHVH01007465.1.p1  ORF type:complete len:150 (+),score=31.34 GHVH01007465.1:357-806(+)